jgi:hypothetical protein
MGCCDGFFMGNSLSDPEDLLIPFVVTDLSCAPEDPIDIVYLWQ